MNEKKKTIVVISIIAVILLFVILLIVRGDKESEELYNQFETAFNGEENTLIYIGRPTCPYCNLLDPNIKDMKERYGIDYIYINTDEFGSSYRNKVMEKLGLSKLGTPYLAVVSNGKVVDTQNGYADYDKLFKFLQENEIISEEAELSLNYIGYEEYKDLLNSKKASVIVIGQSTYQYCIKAKLILNDIADENDITINYLNISYLSSEEGANFEKSLEYFQENDWGTPIMMIVKKGEIIDMIEQLTTEEKYIEFLTENGVL